MRRGLCPGLLDPMPTGDGLLARLPPAEPLAPAALVAICRAAVGFGNGIMEVTARGSLQARGLTPASAGAFAAACRAAGLAERGGPPIVASPLGAAGPGALADIRPLVAALRAAVPAFAGRVAPKVTVAVDDGGDCHLDRLAADIRLRAVSDDRFLLGIAGDGTDAEFLGVVETSDAVAAVVAILAALAAAGPPARVRDLSDPGRVVARWVKAAAVPPCRSPARFIGMHRLSGSLVAIGLGLPFGQAEAGKLEALAQAAAVAGAGGIAPAPERTLLAIGMRPAAAAALVVEAGLLGFITRAEDPRRNVIACAGAPACAAAHIPTRRMAAAVLQAAGPMLAAGSHIHLSGCAKACASRVPAALTIVGTAQGCAIIRDGQVGDAPEAVVPAAELVGRIARLAVPEPA